MIARHLELRIPPVLLTLLFALLIWLTSLWSPAMVLHEQARLVFTVILVSLGVLIAISGVVSFRRAKTTVNPTRPDTSSSLVTTGIYKLTRNPMYLGLLIMLVAWSTFLSNFYGLVLCLVYVLYLNRFQIQPEERAMQSSFGVDYSDYKTRVRRWL